jgi:hypothetical protein
LCRFPEQKIEKNDSLFGEKNGHDFEKQVKMPIDYCITASHIFQVGIEKI